MGRHSKPGSLAPLTAAGAILGTAWVALIGSAQTATATQGFAVAVPRHEHRPAPPRAAPIPLGRKVVDAALTKLGVPYVWGAKGPNTFDCSGLTGWAWRLNGVPLGPDTYTQIHQGRRVTDIKPGDLIFPSTHHVQLAISATQVIEAPGRGMVVRIAPMPKQYTAIRPTPRSTT